MAGWFEGMFQDGALPTMERSLAFSADRHRLILENIANADTPGYRRKDLDAAEFREALEEAIRSGPGKWRELDSETFFCQECTEGPYRQGMLRHDRNNVDIEMELALLGRNAAHHNQMASLLRKEFEEIRMAIAERPL
jgi:flagellar basal-body rod protein FlgB